jgi:hypothetical protein
MSLSKIRLELARTREAPEGDPRCGYEFIAPLDDAGRFDEATWRQHKSACTVRRFWPNADDERGMLVHTRSHRWVFSYAPGDDDDEPLFKFDRHLFKVGEYVSVTEHDGITRPFRITAVSALRTPAA